MLKLYDCTTAPSPRRTRIFLAEKGVEYENIQVDLRSGEQLSDAFKAINPRCAVPALATEDGNVITENVAIAAYVENLHPNPPLMGSTALEKARILEWNWRAEFEGLAAIAEILRNTAKGMKGRAMTGPHAFDQIPELAARGRMRLGHFFEELNNQLKDNAFVAGDNYSFADITAMVAVDFAEWVKASPDESLTNLYEWHNRVSARPSATA